MDNVILYSKLNALPENLKSEVLHFVEFLLTKKKSNNLKHKPVFGSAKGMFVIKDNFDDPIDDFAEYS